MVNLSDSFKFERSSITLKGLHTPNGMLRVLSVARGTSNTYMCMFVFTDCNREPLPCYGKAEWPLKGRVFVNHTKEAGKAGVNKQLCRWVS